MKKIIFYLVLIGLIIGGLGLIFNSQIIAWWIQTQSAQKAQTISKSQEQQAQKKKASFDFKKVQAVNQHAIAESLKAKKEPAIGTISIPSVDIHLPIFKGLNDSELTIGVGTMKPGEQMGRGNYALAGHHMENPNVLFSPLSKIRIGDKVFLKNPNHVFTYQVDNKRVVQESNIKVINNQGKKRIVTLITCASGRPGETRRLIVTGKLINVK